MKNEPAQFILALQFLTRLPLPSGDLYTPERMAASVKYYPLVGVMIGALSAGSYWAAQLALPHALSVIAAVAIGLLFTGAFHEDGLADTFDGIGGGQSREDVLFIMKDSRLGVYGTAALVMALALKAGALISLPPQLVIGAFIAGHATSRFSAVLVIATSRYVRAEGTGKPVADGVSGRGLAVAGLTVIGLWLFWCWFWSPMALVWGVAGLAAGHILMRLFFERKLGGYTGDTLGAVQQASEIGFYLGLATWL